MFTTYLTGKNSFLFLGKGLQRVQDHRGAGGLWGTVTLAVGQCPQGSSPAPWPEGEQGNILHKLPEVPRISTLKIPWFC